MASDIVRPLSSILFFFNDPSTTEIYTLSLHDALPICVAPVAAAFSRSLQPDPVWRGLAAHLGARSVHQRSEEHTSELQSRRDLVCRLLLEKKKKINPDTAR